MLKDGRCFLVQDLVTALPLANGHGNITSHFGESSEYIVVIGFLVVGGAHATLMFICSSPLTHSPPATSGDTKTDHMYHPVAIGCCNAYIRGKHHNLIEISFSAYTYNIASLSI